MESAYARAMTAVVTTFCRFWDYYVVFRVFYVLIWAVSSVGMTFEGPHSILVYLHFDGFEIITFKCFILY